MRGSTGNEFEKVRGPVQQRQSWEPMRLTYVGHVADVIQTGPGKLTPVGGDPGEARKQIPVA